jgi:Protein of unknown function (DUF3618)
MGQDQGQAGAQQLATEPHKSAEELRVEIEDTRRRLGETAAELAARTDVKARAHDKVEQLKRSVGSRGGGGGSAVEQLRSRAQRYPVPTAAAGALVGGFLLGRLVRRRGD